MANINFTPKNGIYEAEVTATGTFNLHVAVPKDSVLSIYVRGVSNTNDILTIQTKDGIHRDIVGEVWNKVFRLVCNKQPIEATYTLKE